MRIELNPNGTSGVILIDSEKVGPRVVIFGGSHGDETSGILSVRKLAIDFKESSHRLTKGSVTLVEANERGIAAARWYFDRDLNELFKDPPELGDSYEHRRVEELKQFLKRTDFFLDLHSTPIGIEPFVVTENKHVEFFSQIGISKVVTGWTQMDGGDSGGDAESYANACGAVSATIEAGSDNDPEVGYLATLALLSHLEMIDPPAPAKKTPTEIFQLYYVQIKESEDFQYIGEPDNFKFVPKEVEYARQNGVSLKAPKDSYLLMPHIPADTAVGEKISYLALKIQ